MKHYNKIFDFQRLKDLTNGSADIRIGLIDGPVAIDHPDLNSDNILVIEGALSGACTVENSPACGHGTFIAGILKGKRNVVANSLATDCTLIVRPIFSETNQANQNMPTASPKDLSKAIVDLIDAKARILNLSLALAIPTSKKELELEEALNYAAKAGVIVVAAAGNQGIVGSTAITRHPWVIPVVASDNYGKVLQLSNLGNSIGRYGLCAQGDKIVSLGTTARSATLTGTSVAVPFVTGTIALLWSIYPQLSGTVIKNAVRGTRNRKSIKPPDLNPNKALEYLRLFENQMART